MITIKEFLETVDYRITEGDDYCQVGRKAHYLSCWNGVHGTGGWAATIVFDTDSQEVLRTEVCDYTNNRAYRRVVSDLKDVEKEAWDNIDWIDLETDEDFVEKFEAIVGGRDYDARVSIPLDIPDDELLAAMKLAHEKDMTFNEYVTHALEEFIKNHKSLLEQKTSWTVELEEDSNGDIILPFPEDFLALKGWKEGDTLEWLDNQDGSWTIEKVSEAANGNN